MKVVFLSGVFARNGGIEEFTRDLALALICEGVEVGVLCAALKNPTLQDMKQSGVEITKVPVYYGCRWHIPDYALLPFALRKLRGASVVIHQKPFKPSFYRFISRQPKHVFLTSYSPVEQFGSGTGAIQFFSFFDAVITQVEEFRKELRNFGIKCPIHVLPLIPPVAQTKVAQLPAGRKLRVAMMGRLEEQKNPLYALEIADMLAQDLRKEGTEVEFHVYGGGSLLPILKQRTRLMTIDVRFHGAYERREVSEIVSANDLFLITSVSEGQCIVALEILSGGRPLFSTPVGALPYILNKSERGALLPVNHADIGAVRIRKWLKSHQPISAERILKSYMQDYDAESIKHEYLEIIKGIIQGE